MKYFCKIRKNRLQSCSSLFAMLLVIQIAELIYPNTSSADPLIITDVFDEIKDKLTFQFFVQFSDLSTIRSDPIALRTKNPNQSGTMYAEVRGCMIGNQKVSDDSVTLKFDGKKNYILSGTRQNFIATFEMSNAQHLTGALSCAYIGIFLAGESKPVTLASINGQIRAAPGWTDSLAVPISTATFSFATLIASGNPATDVTSSPLNVSLSNATTYPATVSLILPTSCFIGALPVLDSHVQFSVNGGIIGSNTNFSIPSASNQAFAVQFASLGNYGNNSGAVSCTNNGSLTYTY